MKRSQAISGSPDSSGATHGSTIDASAQHGCPNKNRPSGISHSAGFAIRSPRGLGEPHDSAPRGSQHLSLFQSAAAGPAVKKSELLALRLELLLMRERYSVRVDHHSPRGGSQRE